MTEQPAQIDVAHFKGWIGREERRGETLSPELTERYRATLDLPGDTAAGAIAPRLIHYCLCQPAVPTGHLGKDGHPPKRGFLPPVPLPHRMWAGSRLSYASNFIVGERVERRSRIADVVVKQGRSGSLCFVTVVHEVASNGRHVVTEEQDIVYREAVSELSGTGGNPAERGRWTRYVTASAPLLFRYSALTFNGHRIHYDKPYAMEVEFYPGLVVHGPLQATWLFELARELKGEAPSSFAYRGQSPLSDGPLQLHVRETENGLALWTSAPGGPVATSAEARWQ